ncbi:FAD/NAD(P)-binding domain-containing protein [Aspergillus steynii IBT 23096]|uniref:FAD/NAD(P)-binding domain-containing protein n=1 Tax=Aspergillus steynii IBT 23096 TaxID=1392250 RepID=A0A2I2G3M7_9EURO|nr:FAD/NAD(P)-binding domain-containing protein [Aspergillus steynii IBT 23096]PLB47482.1 FAD/NAD(P)-binding domain-containing protein [Aspergillus steynii IBT 23096]
MVRAGEVKKVAIVGAGPAGAIAVDAFAQEKAFDVIRVFERREKAGGCWLYDDEQPPPLTDLDALAYRTADKPLDIPDALPRSVPRSSLPRFTDTPVYPALEANIDASIMSFSQEPIPVVRSEASVKVHGPDTPFRHHTVIQKYIEGLLDRNGYQHWVEYNTTVERAEKTDGKWTLTLRRGARDANEDYWWQEEFDALVVASGHYSVPYVPNTPGLKEFATRYPGSVEHTKAFRHPEKYQNKRVVTVGASVSAADTAFSLVDIAQTPVHAVVRGKYNGYFGDEAFKHPKIQRHTPIKRIDSDDGQRTVFFEDGTSLSDVDHLILGTGYSWTLPFLPQIPVRNNRVPDLYLHIFHLQDPTLAFIGAVAAGFTFKVFEWQSVLAARVLAGQATLPPLEQQHKWELDRVQKRGDGVAFTLISPDFEDYFETLRTMAGTPVATEPGRRLPVFDRKWVETFASSHQRRIKLWKRANETARARLDQTARDPRPAKL